MTLCDLLLLGSGFLHLSVTHTGRVNPDPTADPDGASTHHFPLLSFRVFAYKQEPTDGCDKGVISEK